MQIFRDLIKPLTDIVEFHLNCIGIMSLPENLTDRRCCHKCHTTVTGKKKLSKCAQCHSITYCGRECQREDWPRHSQYCIPVMVTEIPGMGKGLVASKDFKRGQVLFKETPAIIVHTRSDIIPLQELKEKVSEMSEEQKNKFYQLTQKGNFKRAQLDSAFRENCLTELDIFFSNSLVADPVAFENKFLFITPSFINHSCAPNVQLEGYRDKDGEEVLVVLAMKDISKGEEITECYMKGLMTSSQMKEKIKEEFSFDCKCGVCVGSISDQDVIIAEINSLVPNSVPIRTFIHQEQKASKLERAADLAKQLYIGYINIRFFVFVKFVIASQLDRDPIRLKKALDLVKEEAVGCWENPEQGYKFLEAWVERWSAAFQSRRNPTKEEKNDLSLCHIHIHFHI